MRVLLVTSEVTYIPKNYLDVFEAVLEEAAPHLAGLMILKGVSLSLLRQTVGLYGLGCRNFSSSLMKNLWELPFRRRERLFASRGIPVIRAKTMNDPSVVRW